MATKEDWLQLVDQEEGELLVLSLIEEIIERSQHVLFEKYIDVQVLPYAVGFARETLLSLLKVPSSASATQSRAKVRGILPSLYEIWVTTDAWRSFLRKLKNDAATAEAAKVRPPKQGLGRNTDAGALQSSRESNTGVSNKSSRKAVNHQAQRASDDGSAAALSILDPTSNSTVLVVQDELSSAAPLSDGQGQGHRTGSTPVGSRSISSRQRAAMGTDRQRLSASGLSARNGSQATNAPMLLQSAPPQQRSWPEQNSSGSGSAKGYGPAASLGAGSGVGAAAAPQQQLQQLQQQSTHSNSIDHVIQEENKRMLARIHNIQKDGGKAEFAYDHEGRIVLVNRTAPGKLMTHG
nr:hypothetical protein HK105_000123 [Polyrhizophydium stewartii]